MSFGALSELCTIFSVCNIILGLLIGILRASSGTKCVLWPIAKTCYWIVLFNSLPSLLAFELLYLNLKMSTRLCFSISMVAD